jgi:hypothetical protein
MTRRLWPYLPLTPATEVLQWATDVLRSKSGEQRIALRQKPRREFNYSHFFRDTEANYARNLIRSAQAGDGFYVPDWSMMSRNIGPISSGIGVTIPANLSSRFYNEKAIVWDSLQRYEIVDVEWDSTGLTVDLDQNYTNPIIAPVFEGNCPDGLSISRSGANQNVANIGFIITDDYNIASSNYPTYRGLDVMTDCPVIGSSLTDDTVWQATTFDNLVGDPEYLRRRSVPEYTFEMGWLLATQTETFELKQWLYSRYGRQKAFWLSTYANDIDVYSISGATVTIFNDVLSRPAEYHVEILGNDGVTYRRKVTNAVALAGKIDGRSTAELTLDSAVAATSAVRCSYLTCARFDSDRIEIEHANRGGELYSQVRVPCREIPEP